MEHVRIMPNRSRRCTQARAAAPAATKTAEGLTFSLVAIDCARVPNPLAYSSTAGNPGSGELSTVVRKSDRGALEAGSPSAQRRLQARLSLRRLLFGGLVQWLMGDQGKASRVGSIEQCAEVALENAHGRAIDDEMRQCASEPSGPAVLNDQRQPGVKLRTGDEAA